MVCSQGFTGHLDVFKVDVNRNLKNVRYFRDVRYMVMHFIWLTYHPFTVVYHYMMDVTLTENPKIGLLEWF